MSDAPARADDLDPLPYHVPWPSLRSATGRIDVHSLVAFWVRESRIAGHYLEFGVGAGRSAVAAIRAHRREVPDGPMKFFLFDSFAGLPPLEGSDEDSHQFHEGQFAFDESQVRAKLAAHGVWDPARVSLVPGFYEQSLPAFDRARFGEFPAAVVHVDVDLYQSAKQVLAFVTPLLVQGSILMFDDWNAFDASWAHGERAATREWLEANAAFNLESYARYGWHGEAFLVHRTG